MREFYIQDDGIKLHSKLDMPEGITEDGGGKCPLVIVIHGLTGHMEETHIVAVSELLNSMGFATLRVEMYGHGRSGGDFHEHNLMKWLNNAMTVTDYARKLPFVTDLYACGHSQGGAAVIFLAGMMPEYFRAVMPLSPATMIPEGSRKGYGFGYSFDTEHIPEEVPVNAVQKVSGNYIRAAQMLDIDWAIRRYNGPVLIVHGDEDEAIPVSFSEKTAEKYTNAELVVVSGDDHCYNYHLDRVIDAVRDFMAEQTVEAQQ